MRILIAGGSGFLGSALVQKFGEGASITLLSRGTAPRSGLPPGLQSIAWTDRRLPHVIRDTDLIINLAGESIASGRWSSEKKGRIAQSRIETTRQLVEAILDGGRTDQMLINASAVGFYGDRGEEVLTEASPAGDDFLAHTCVAWEGEAQRARPRCHVALLRFGMILSRQGGALGRMVFPFRLFAGGPIGRGAQWVSWIDLADAVSLVAWVAEARRDGIYNAVAPSPARNREMAAAIGTALRRPAAVPAPRLALRALFGEMADTLLFSSQRVIPRRALEEGFAFRFPAIDGAMEFELSRKKPDES